jgi:hypothetical protein
MHIDPGQIAADDGSGCYERRELHPRSIPQPLVS